MFRKSSSKSSSFSSAINTMVGKGSSLKGDLKVDGFLRLDGDLIGNVKCTERVVIGSDARMKGDIIAQEVVVAGAFVGDIIAHSKVKILSTALVMGTIRTKRMEVEEDAIFDGLLSVKDSPEEESNFISDIRQNKVEYFSPWKKNDKKDIISSTSYATY